MKGIYYQWQQIIVSEMRKNKAFPHIFDGFCLMGFIKWESVRLGWIEEYTETDLKKMEVGSGKSKLLAYVCIIKKQEQNMLLTIVKLQNFFQKPDPATARHLLHSQRLLQAFFAETAEGPFEKKITLMDQYLTISQKINDQYEPVLFLQISDAITFHRLQRSHDPKSKTSLIHGFSLINAKNQTVRIFLQFETLSQLWMAKLSQFLNQLGFHEQYKIIDRIGKGSTSIVYKVQRIADGKMFAAKAFLKSFLQSKPQRRSSVFNEISLLRAMNHKNILKIHSVYQSTSTIYIVTQHLEGGTLFERINQLKGFKLPQVKKIMKDIIEGLNYMHRFGVMHRDIKLENIMFRQKESFDAVIVDFGLAAISEDESYIFYRCGTPGFIAPQIIDMQSNQKIEVACDIFSAGAILHVLLTNRYLFVGQDNKEIYQANKNLSFDLQHQSYLRCDPQGLDLLSLMLEVDYEQRISAEQILCHQFLQGTQTVQTQKDLVSPARTSLGEEMYVL